MRSKKLRSIVAMAAMTGVVSMASNGHTTKKIDKKLLASNEIASDNSSSSNINPNDLNIQISNISVTKESANGFTNNTDYIPENSIPKTTNIATSNTEMIYKIAVSLSSKTGKLYKVPKLYLTANPFAQYMDKNSDDPKEKQAAEEIVKSINMQLGQLKNLNSTSTFVITAILRVGSSDWDVNVKPNIELHAVVGDKEKVVPVQVPDIRLTNHYTDTVYAGIQIGHSEENKHESYLDIGFSNANTSENNPGIYNPANYKPQSITFKINNPDPKDIDIIPLNVAGFSTNPNGTYTVDSRLIGQVNRLFKVITKTNGVLNKEITVTPISEKYNTNVDLNKTTTFNYDSASATLTQNAIGDSFSMSQDTQASSWYAPYDTFSSELSAGVPGKYKVYSGSLLSNGNIVVINGKDFIGLKPQTYVSLNQNAENIFLSGTPTEKANLFQRIVNGDMAGIGQSFSYDQILQMYKSGEKIPTLNFTYKSEDYNGNPLKMVGYYHEIPTKGAWTPLINRVFTLGILQGNYSKQEKENMANAIGNGGLSSDTIIKNNGEFSGFLLSPPNNITNEDMDESKPVETPAGNGTYHTTEIRYGSISHDISSTVTYAYEKVTTTIDTPKGSGNIIQNHPVSWLDSSHKFYFYIYGYGSGVTEQYTKDTVLEVNMGAPFVLTSPVTISGVTVPKENCKIEGNKLFIKFPQRFYMGSQLKVEFDAHYITFGPQTITVSGRLVGKTGDQGIVYNYNNNENANQLTGGAANQVILTNHQILTGDSSSDCMHYANDIDSNDNVTLTDVIHNGKYSTKDYLVVGQIPTAGSDNLPGNEGSPGVGGLGSKLLSLDTHGVPTWVLPKSALNSTNQKILDDPDALDLKGMLQYIESPESGWVKYVPGETDLSDMIAYAVTPTIEPGQDYILNYQVHLTGITPDNYQIVNSAFKYYIPTDEVGSTSNIVNLTPPGENLSYDWISKVVDSDGHALPNNVLNNTVDYNGHKISLNDLIGHGADNDGNFDLTPTELQNKVDLATNKEAMQKLGYKLDGIYVNGQQVSKEWFETVGILDNSTLTHIKFVVSKTYTDTVKVVDTENKELVPENSVSGTPGSDTDLKTPDIPKGYHIENITDGSGKTITELPKTFGDKNEIIIYHVVKDPSTTVAEVYKDGTNVVPIKTTLNAPNAKVDTAIPELPNGYQITKITVNGKVVSQSEVPTVQSTDNQTIVYTIDKMPTDTVKVIDNNGNELVPVVSKTGKTGTETGLKTPDIPKDYHIVKITDENGKTVTGVPTVFGNSDNTTIYHVAKDITDKVYVDVKTESGTVLTPSHEVASGAPGAKVNVEMPEIPKDYHIVKVIVDGNVIKPDANGKYELPKTLSDNQNQEVDDHIDVIVAKNPTTTVEEKYQDGTNVVPDKTTINLQGTKVETGLPELPEGYKVIKITVNGKEVSQNEVPTVQSADNQTIIYTIGKVSTDTVKVVDENNQPMVPEVSVTGVSGTETGLKTPEIPNGYHIVSVTDNNKTVEAGVPSKFTNDNQNIVYHIAKDPSTTVEEVYSNGTPVVTSKTTVNLTGTKVDTAIPDLPSGYQITKITVNGKVVSENEVPTVQSADNQTIVYTIDKMPTDTVKVVYNNKDLIPAVSKTGKTGTETGLKTPEIPKGYHIVKITDGNGNTVTGVPTVFGNSDNTTIYHIAKDITDKVYVDVKTESGTVLTPSHEVASGAPGAKVNVQMPEIPNNYHIVKVIVDRNIIKPDANGKYELPNTLSNNQNQEVDDHINVIVAKNPTTTVEEKYQDGTNVVPDKTTINLQGAKVETGLPELPEGYKVIKITVNGKEVSQNEVPTIQSENDQTIIYTIGKVSTDTVKVVDENNQPVVPEVSVTGVSGTETGLKAPEIPSGYHIVSVTNNGKTVEAGVPSKFTNDDQNIVYHIAKDPSTTVEEVYSNGTPVVSNKTTVNLAGTKVDTAIPELPNGYQIIKITVNGKVVSENEVPTTQSEDNQTIIYTIDKMPTDTVKVVDNNGNELVPAVSKTGKTGSKTGLNTPDIPKGYHIVKITDGNGNIVTGVPTIFGNSDNTTIYHVAKDITDKVYVDVKTESGTILTPSHEVASGAPGAKVNVEMPEIPKDYHIVKVIVNGNIIIPDANGKYELPKTLSDNRNQEVDDHIDVIVAKNPTTTVEEKYQDGTNVVPDKTTINLQGAKVETGLPELPEGYKVIKITVNGKEVSQNEVPTVQGADDQTIIYTIGKISTDTVKVVDENNQSMVPEVSVTGVSGTNTGLKNPKIPEGYHIVSVTNNGKTVEAGVPSKFTNDDQNIVYHIAKDPSTTVEEVYSNGTPVVTSKTTVNLAGAKVDTAIPELPNGYQITKITVNGKVVSENEVPTVQSADNQTIIYTIDKMPTDTVKIVDNNGNELVPAVSKTGKTGSKTGLNTPEIPKGYHIVKITDGNGNIVTGVPTVFGNSDNTTIYHVAKDITDKVYVDIKTESGTILTPSHEVASGAPGAKVNVEMPEIPKDYHIVKVIVDGNIITPDANGKYELPKTLSDNQNQEVDDHIEVIVAKNPTTTVEEKYQDGTNVVPDKTTINLQGAKVETGLPKLPEGYKVIKITVNGKEVSQNEVPTVQSADDQTIIYTIGKISTDTGKIVDGNDGGDTTHHLEKDITDKVYINVVTQSGDILVPNHQIASGKPGSKIDINIPNIPDDYHITKVIVNDNTLTTDENGNYQLPKTLSSDKSKEVDYNIKVIVAKNTSSTTINEIYSSNNKDVVPSKTITGPVGSKVDTSIPKLPNGYKIEKIIVNGNVVDQSEVPTVQGNTNNNITYVIGKISNNDDHNNNTPDKPNHDNTGNTTDGNHNNVDPNKPSDTTHNNDDHKNNTPDNPSHDNTGNTTGGNHNNVDHNKPSDSTHNNDDHKNNTPDKPNHDITGNTTDGNHNNVDPNKPSDSTHNNDDHKNNTPDNPSHDNTGNTTGDNHNNVDHDKPSDSTHNNDNHKNTTPDKPSDNNTGNTTNDNNHKNVEPTKPVDTGNTESNKIINPKVDNTNESNNTTSKSNVDINSTGTPDQINELPHTGLSNNDNNIAKEAGVLAGILSTLAALFFFRKKK